ncbi:MAG: hypothetical protein LBB26_01400 [Puniceicoccales bacterium]|nr:hypothetical protein [Puniceicoccales bacterium]
MGRRAKFLGILENAFKGKKHHGKFTIDSIPVRLCLRVRLKRFKTMREAMGIAVSSTKKVCGFKVHVMMDIKGKKVVNFCFPKWSSHDANHLEEIFQGCSGCSIGNSGYVSWCG